MSAKRTLNRPHSLSANLDELEDDKKKKKWSMKLFRTESQPETTRSKAEAIKPSARSKVSSIFRDGSDEISQLHEKINELEDKLETYKQARYIPLDQKNIVSYHQRSRLDETTWKEFRFKGAIAVKNKNGEEIELLEVVPDSIEIVDSGTEAWLKQTILDVNVEVVSSKELEVSKPKSLSFFYYLQEKNEMRYDHLFNVHINYKDILRDFKEFLESKEKTTDYLEISDFCNNHEVKTRIQVVTNSTGQQVPLIKDFYILIPIPQPKQPLEVVDPIFSTKTIQNYWFDLEVCRKGDEGYVLGPFSPSEQQLSMEDSHYFIEQDIPLPGFAVLGTPKNNDKEKKIEKVSSHEHIFVLNYYVRDRSQEDSSLFCICSIEVSLAEIVKCSEGNQKLGDRFRMEKQLGLGVIRVTFHFYVCEEMIPEPSTSGQALNPLCGYWILERVSFAIRV